MTSCSSYTYRDYAVEYEATEDYNLWDCEYLNNEYSIEKFNEKDLRISLFDISLSDRKDHSILPSPRLFLIEQSDDFVMEPMLTSALSCTESISRLLGDIHIEPDSISICAATYGLKNMIFRLPNCILCTSADKSKIYVPTSFVRKIKEDLSFRDIYCVCPGLKKTAPFYGTILTDNVLKDCETIGYAVKGHKVTSDHEPMYSDGFSHYTMIEACIYVTLIPRRTIGKSDYGNGPITFHGKRQIKIYALSISEQPSALRNHVALFTSNGDDSKISQRGA